MPLVTDTADEIRDRYLQNVAGLNPEIDTSQDSEVWVNASALGAAIEGVLGKLQYVAKQIFAESADLDNLLRVASRYKIFQRVATFADGGTIAFAGTPGSVIGIGVVARALNGAEYLTTAGGTIGGGGAISLAGRAVVAGLAGNQSPPLAGSLVAAPSGVDSEVTIAGMTGGTEIESPASILERLLFRWRHPPGGGNKFDYRRWAMEVPGVVEAFVYPLRRYVGEVDVTILTAGGLAGAPLVAQVQAHINAERPCKGECLVLAPTALPVNITGTLTLAAGYLLIDVVAAINVELDKYFAALEPGEIVYRHQIMTIITTTPGVVDLVLAAPAANVAALVNATNLQLATKGAVALT